MICMAVRVEIIYSSGDKELMDTFKIIVRAKRSFSDQVNEGLKMIKRSWITYNVKGADELLIIVRQYIDNKMTTERTLEFTKQDSFKDSMFVVLNLTKLLLRPKLNTLVCHVCNKSFIDIDNSKKLCKCCLQQSELINKIDIAIVSKRNEDIKSSISKKVIKSSKVHRYNLKCSVCNKGFRDSDKKCILCPSCSQARYNPKKSLHDNTVIPSITTKLCIVCGLPFNNIDPDTDTCNICISRSAKVMYNKKESDKPLMDTGCIPINYRCLCILCGKPFKSPVPKVHKCLDCTISPAQKQEVSEQSIDPDSISKKYDCSCILCGKPFKSPVPKVHKCLDCTISPEQKQRYKRTKEQRISSCRESRSKTDEFLTRHQ